MDQNVEKVGIGVLVYGTRAQDNVWGLCDDITDKPQKDKEEVEDGDGDTVGLIYTKPRRQITMNYTPLATATATDPPKILGTLIGKTMTVLTPDGTSLVCYVDECEMKATRKAKATMAITATYYPAITPAT